MDKWNDTSPGPTDKGNSIGNWKGGWLNGKWKCPKCQTIIGKNLRGQTPFALVAKHSCFEWDVKTVKEKLPNILIRIRGKTHTARLSGHLDKFATVTVNNYEQPTGPFYRDFSYSWTTIANCLNNNQPLEI